MARRGQSVVGEPDAGGASFAIPSSGLSDTLVDTKLTLVLTPLLCLVLVKCLQERTKRGWPHDGVGDDT